MKYEVDNYRGKNLTSLSALCSLLSALTHHTPRSLLRPPIISHEFRYILHLLLHLLSCSRTCPPHLHLFTFPYS
jgi:hypothetical protein